MLENIQYTNRFLDTFNSFHFSLVRKMYQHSYVHTLVEKSHFENNAPYYLQAQSPVIAQNNCKVVGE